jgi:hypothetical protein
MAICVDEQLRRAKTAGEDHQPSGCIAEPAGHGHQIPGASPAPSYRFRAPEVTQGGDSNDQRRAGGDVSPHDHRLGDGSLSGEPVREVLNPVNVKIWRAAQGN